jgi:excinuclease ABC subunit C
MSLNKNLQSLSQKIKSAPTLPGCYLFKDKNGNIIYVGKAKSIRNRVQSYLTNGQSKDPKTTVLISRAVDIEFFVTNSEVEALILENTLIKEHKPRYNISLRDDKTFPYVRITNEEFPRVFVTRRVIKDGSRYFGPYTDVGSLRSTLRIIKQIFPVRSCKYKLDQEIVRRKKVQLCLDYHIKKCEGPCQGLVSAEDYNKMIDKMAALLQGKTSEVIDYFKENMTKASSELRFEDAGRYRDNIETIQSYSRTQSVELSDSIDRDLVDIVIEEGYGCAVVFKIRGGKLIGRNSIFLEKIIHHEMPEIMQNFIQLYYSKLEQVPKEILVNAYPENKEILEKWLSEIRTSRVEIKVPVRRDKVRLLRMAERNAKLQLREYLLNKSAKGEYIPKSLNSLQKSLNLPKLPRRIEAFDISNIRGKFSVASLVTFINATPKKSEYRRFKIKTVKRIDDYSSISEVVKRRYTRQLKEGKPLPNLILIDGGKGQVNIAKSTLDNLRLSNIPIIGLAKRLEEIYLPEKSEPIILPRDSVALTLLRKIRDEAHRFAVTYHRNLRGKGEVTSQLDMIPGLGNSRKKELMKYFGTISKIAAASTDDLCKVEGIGEKLAHKIWNYLHG